MKKTDKMLLELLKISVMNPNDIKKVTIINYEQKDIDNIIDEAKRHNVLALLYDAFEELFLADKIAKEQFALVKNYSQLTVLSNYRLLMETERLVKLLSDNGITCVVLKGAGTAAKYPVPELRKSGDVDILIPDKNAFNKAEKILSNAGYIKDSKQFTNHHLAFTNEAGIDFDIHSMLSEPFDCEQVNKYNEALLEKYKNTVIEKCISAVALPIPQKSYDLYYHLLHMLQHFLRAGCGIKLICDWAVLLKSGMTSSEKETLLSLLEDTKTLAFAEMITQVGVKYLGLDKDCFSTNNECRYSDAEVLEFLDEIFEAGEFGKAGKERMVAVREQSIGGYIREFHHQMRLNHPKSSRLIILWPVLWIVTFIVFIYNNLFIRKTSMFSIIKKTKERSSIIDKLGIFR